MEVELFHENRLTDMTELIITIRHFANASKYEYFRKHVNYSKCSIDRGIVFLYNQFMGNSEELRHRVLALWLGQTSQTRDYWCVFCNV